MDEARKLGEFVQTSSELTELATKSIQLLHIDLRSGRTPDLSKFEERVGPMFEIMDPMPSEIDNLSSTIVQTSSYRRMPGQPKRSRILASSETRKKKNPTNQILPPFTLAKFVPGICALEDFAEHSPSTEI